MKRRTWIILIIVLAAPPAAYLATSGSRGAPAPRRERVARGTVARKATAVGRIEVPYEVSVNSGHGGILTKLFVKLGEKVEKGQSLAEVRPVVTEETLLQAERALEAAERGEERAREYRDGEHIASQLSRLFTGKKDIDRMYRSAEEGREEAQERLELLKSGEVVLKGRKVDYLVRAPVAGNVLEIRQREGAPIVPSSTFGTGSVILVLADLSQLLFRGTVDEVDVGRLKEGMPARLRIGTLPGTTVGGRVAEIALRSGEKNNAIVFEIRIELEKADAGVLRSGYSAVAEIEVDRRENVLVLPERLVEFRGDSASVDVPDGRGGRARKEIRTGLSDGLTVEVVDGLPEGSEVLERASE